MLEVPWNTWKPWGVAELLQQNQACATATTSFSSQLRQPPRKTNPAALHARAGRKAEAAPRPAWKALVERLSAQQPVSA